MVQQTKIYIGILGAAKIGVIAAADENGTIIAHSTAPPLNFRINPHIQDALLQAFQALSLKLGQDMSELIANTRGLAIAMSGVYQPGDMSTLSSLLSAIHCVGDFAPILCEDVWAVLAAAGHDQGGVILLSTGINVFLRNTAGTYVRVGGWGSELADLGSGYYIGKQAINAVLDSEDGRRAGSQRLNEQVLESLGLASIQQIVPWYYEVRKTPFWRARIADLAANVVRLAETECDFRALGILCAAGREVEQSLLAAIAQSEAKAMFEGNPSIPMVIDGGLGRNSRYLQNLINGVLHQRRFARWTSTISHLHPVVGSVAFALSGRTTVPDQSKFEKLQESANRLGLAL